MRAARATCAKDSETLEVKGPVMQGIREMGRRLWGVERDTEKLREPWSMGGNGVVGAGKGGGEEMRKRTSWGREHRSIL